MPLSVPGRQSKTCLRFFSVSPIYVASRFTLWSAAAFLSFALGAFFFLVAMWFLPNRGIQEGRPPLQNSGPRPGVASWRRYLRRVFVCCSCLDFFSLVAAFFDVMDFLLIAPG